MSKFKRTNKLPMEAILVGYANSAMAKSGALVGAGAAYNINAGQLGVVSWDLDSTAEPLGDYLTGDETPSTVRAIKVVQGTPNSGTLNAVSAFEENDKGLVSSGIIKAEQVRSVSARLPYTGQNGAVVLSSFTAPANETEYRLYVELNSIRDDRDFGGNDNLIHANLLTPNYTALATTAPLSHALHNLAHDLNVQSRLFGGNRNVVVFGVDTGGGTGTAIEAITCGTVINVITLNGVTQGVAADNAIMNTLYEIVAAGGDINGASSIFPIDITTAGAADNIDALIIMSLPHVRGAYFDNIPFVRSNVNVRPAAGFLATTGLYTQLDVNADEGRGQGWRWLIDSDNRNQLNIHTMQNRPFMEEYSKGVSYIDPDALYTSYIVEYYDWEETLTTRSYDPKTLTILLPTTVACADPDSLTPTAEAATITTAALVTDIENILTDWLEANSGVELYNPDSTGLIA